MVAIGGGSGPAVPAFFTGTQVFGLLTSLRTTTAALPQTTTSDATVQLTALISQLNELNASIESQTQTISSLNMDRTALVDNITTLTELQNTELVTIRNAQGSQFEGVFDAARTTFSNTADSIVIPRSTAISDLGSLDTQLDAVQGIINGSGGVIPDSATLLTLAARGTGSIDPESLGTMLVQFDPTDAASLTLDPATQGVLQINDTSPTGGVVDNAVATGAATAPTLEENAFGAGQNGLRFDGVNSFMGIADSTDLNLGATTQRSLVIAFRTGSDINRQQILYEEGGPVNGLSVAIENGQLVLALIRNSGATADDVAFGSVPIQANQETVATIIFDGPTRTLTLRVSGGVLDTVSGPTVPNNLPNHPDNIGLGGVNQNAIRPDLTVATAGSVRFEGTIGYFAQFDTALTRTEAEGIENFVAGRLNIEIVDPLTQINAADDILTDAITAFNTELAALDTQIATATAELTALQAIASSITTATSSTLTTTTSLSALYLQLANPQVFGNFGASVLRSLTA